MKPSLAIPLAVTTLAVLGLAGRSSLDSEGHEVGAGFVPQGAGAPDPASAPARGMADERKVIRDFPALPAGEDPRSFRADALVAGRFAGPSSLPYRVELEEAISRADWRRLTPGHQRMLDNLAPPRAGSGGAGASDGTFPAARPSVCFAPGTPDYLVHAFSTLAAEGPARTGDSAFSAQAMQFGSRPRWSRTAGTTSPSLLSQGDPTVVTWSFVPDGTPIAGSSFGDTLTAGSDLKAWLNRLYGRQDVWSTYFERVFGRWSERTGIRFVYEPNDDGAAFPSSRGIAGVRGDVRIGARFIDGPSDVLGYNYYPDVSDMVLDSGDSFFADLSQNSLRLRNVVGHEAGHGLGLAHCCPTNGTKLMEPRVTSAIDGPQHDDVFSAQRQYGDVLEDPSPDGTRDDNDHPSRAADLGTVSALEVVAPDLSIDDAGDVDYLRFSPPGSGFALNLTLHPVGTVYLEGPQEEECTAGVAFDSRGVHNLGFELLDASGLNVLAVRNANPAGSDESLVDFPLPNGAEPYLIRVFGDASANAQLYEVRLSVPGGPPPHTIGAANLSVSEAVGQALLPVTLATPALAPVTVRYQTQAGTASNPGDFSTISGTLVFPTGSDLRHIAVPIANDSGYEPPEYFTVFFSSPTFGVLAASSTRITITDDDPFGPTIQISDAGVTEGAGFASLTISLSAPTTAALTVDYFTGDGTAIAPGDYRETAGTVGFAAGAVVRNILIPITNDTTHESAEAFTVGLRNQSLGNLGKAEGTVTLDDNDAVPRISVVSIAGAENGGLLSVPLSMATASTDDVTVGFFVLEGTALRNVDYVHTVGTVTIPAGLPGGFVDISLIDDSDFEADETLSVLILNPQNATINPAAARGTASILDDEAATVLTGGVGLTATAAPDGSTTLRWDSYPGRTYTVESSTDLEAWEAYPGGMRIPAASSETHFTLPARSPGDPPARYFRVRDDPVP